MLAIIISLTKLLFDIQYSRAYIQNDQLTKLCLSVLLCRGQGEALTIDRRELHLQLYGLLLDAPLQPLAAVEDDPIPDDPGGAAHALSQRKAVVWFWSHAGLDIGK